MCLAIPGKIIQFNDDGTTAKVDFDGIIQDVVVALISEPKIGKYVIVHAGYAIEQMDEAEALEAIEQWKEIAENQDLNLSEML